jgi:nucleotide-binding universal stress UspA family protein
MNATAPGTMRRVFVLGREQVLDVEPEARRAAADGSELVLVTVGYPITDAQDDAVRAAVRLAGELGFNLDAVLATTPGKAAKEVGRADAVEIVATGKERKRLERALGIHPTEVNRPPPKVLVGAGMGPGVTTTLVAAPGAPAPRSSDNPDVSDDTGPLDLDLTATESVEALTGREVVRPIVETAWSREDALARKNARFIVYLGAAPGVGKTFAMLDEGQRRKARGTDVVVGIAQTYGRPKTMEQLRGLEVIPPRSIAYRGTEFDEMDAEALIERRPEVALIDELAHTNIPGSHRAKRWEDVLDVLAEGIIVITTVNVQHMASLNDVVAEVTGIRQQETVPDWVVDLADQVELVDMSPYALRRRMIHGNVYPDPRKSELALQRFFTEDNLTALRDLALMRVANQVDEDLLGRWSKSRAPETRERVLACVSRPVVSDDLVRRAARIAQRARGDLVVVHSESSEEHHEDEWATHTERLVRELGGEFHILQGDDAAEAVLSFAYRNHVTQIVVGESLRSRIQEAFRGSFVNELIRKASNIDVHVIARRER